MPFEFNYLGDCHHIALALHQLSGLPLCVLYGEREDDSETEYVLIHMGVMYQDSFYDELGNQSEARYLLKDLQQFNEPYSFTEIYHFETPCQGLYNLLAQTQAHVHQEKVDKFMQWVLERKEKFPFLK